MNILFVCHRLPFPPNRGGKIRPFNMIRHLSQHHSVVVASLAESAQELREGDDLKKYCTEVITEVLPVPIRWMQACRALVTRTPSSVAYFYSSRLQRRIRNIFCENDFDVVFVHCAFVAQYVIDSQGGFRILDYGDIDSAKWFAYSQARTMPLSLGYSIEARKLRAYEQAVANGFHHSVVTTQGELDELRKLLITMPCAIVPNGVDETYFCQSPRQSQGSSVIVFLGRMDYFPNVDGVLYFVDKIFPFIRQRISNAELRIIGSDPVRKIRDLSRVAGVSVTGYVPDVRPHLIDAAVSVVPLRIARGTQNKILESMAMGIPVVATPEAAKGVKAVPGQHLLVADEPEVFARHVTEIIQNTGLHENLSSAARSLINNTYTWSLSMRHLDSILAHRQELATG